MTSARTKSLVPSAWHTLFLLLLLHFHPAEPLLAQGQDSLPAADYFAWPVGSPPPGEDTVAMGYGYYIQRNFNNNYPGTTLHTGIDLALPPEGCSECSIDCDHTATARQTVYAAAAGRVVCVNAANLHDAKGDYPGRVVVVEHQMGDELLYSVYAHMMFCQDDPFVPDYVEGEAKYHDVEGQFDCVKVGQSVERGQAIGAIGFYRNTEDLTEPWDGNSHLHFEIRRDPYWDHSAGLPSSEGPGEGREVACASPGYLAGGRELLPSLGFRDPVEEIFLSLGRLEQEVFPTAIFQSPSFPNPEGANLATHPTPDESSSDDGLPALDDHRGIATAVRRSDNFYTGENRCPLGFGVGSGQCDWWFEVELGEGLTGFVLGTDKNACTRIQIGLLDEANCPGNDEASCRAASADTLLVIDSSGSMATNDPGGRRLDAARAYLTAALAGDRVGVVDFDSSARLVSPLVPLPEEQQTVLDGLGAIRDGGGTNIGAGLLEACIELGRSTSGNLTQAAILLTDGQGAYGGQAECFANEGWPVYTFGFGASDDALLEEIAAETGGEFRRLPTDDLVCEFQRVRAAIVGGTSAPCRRDLVHPGETVAFDLPVLAGQAQATFSTSWPGSDVVMTLETPSGRRIGRDTVASDLAHDAGPTFEVYTVTTPESGTWQVELFGAEVDPQGEPVTFGFTTLPVAGTPTNRPPDVDAAVAGPDLLWPPNHKMKAIHLFGVVDPEGEPVTLTVTAVHQDEPVSGGGSGHTAPDAEGLGTDFVFLRAEREGAGDGRVYTITFEARDPEGASSTGQVEVCVPHQGGHDGVCGDSGERFDSTRP